MEYNFPDFIISLKRGLQTSSTAEIMRDPYLTTNLKIKDIRNETEEIKLFTLVFLDKKEEKNFQPLPGQIVEIGYSGFGEGPFAVCSYGFENKFFQICVRKIGKLTNKLHDLKIGDTVTMRGPYGMGTFLETKRNLLLIAGGLGLVPLRPLIQKELKSAVLLSHAQSGSVSRKSPRIQLFYGVKSQNEMIFKSEYKEWKKSIDMHVTLDKEENGWNGHVGLITTLFNAVKVLDNPIAILCGPPVMYKFVVQELKRLNFKDEDIFMSLERRMHCGVGVCQHCAVGSKYVCKDGPVFCYKEIKNIPEII